MAFIRGHGNRSINIQMPVQVSQKQIVQFRAKTSEIFTDLKSNEKLKELINLVNTHFILQEYWLNSFKWEEKKIISNIKYRLNFGDTKRERRIYFNFIKNRRVKMRRVSEKSYYTIYKNPLEKDKQVLAVTGSSGYAITNGEGFGDVINSLGSIFSRISDVAKSASPVIKAAGQSGMAVKNIVDAVKSVKDAKGINVSMDILKQMTEKNAPVKQIEPAVVDKFKAQMALGRGLKKF